MESLSIFLYIFAITFIVYLIIAYVYQYSPIRSLTKGHYSAAIEKMERLLTVKTYKTNPKLKGAIQLNIANCYNRKGELRQSIDILDKIDIQNMKDSRLMFGYYGLYAVNLFLLEVEIDRAISMIDKAREILPSNEFIPLLALSEVWKGNTEKALEYLHQYQPNEKGNHKLTFSLKETTLVFDKFTQQIENNYIIALTYLKMGKKEMAYPYLQKATQVDYPNYYTEKAQEELSKF